MRFEALSRNLVVLSSQSHGSFHGWAYKFHLTTQIRNLGYVIKTISVRSNAPFYAYNWLKHVLCRHSWSWESRNGLHPDPNSLPSLLSRLSLTSWYLTDLSTSMITTFDLTSFSALTSCFHRCEDRNFLTPAFCWGFRYESRIAPLLRLVLPLNIRGVYLHPSHSWSALFYFTLAQFLVSSSGEKSDNLSTWALSRRISFENDWNFIPQSVFSQN